MKQQTLDMMNEMVAHAQAGDDVIPMFWQPLFGRSNTVAAAIRAACKRGLLVQNGVDGQGRPKYSAPAPVIPEPTHFSTQTVQ